MYKLMCVGIPPKAIPKDLESDEAYVARRMIVEEDDEEVEDDDGDVGMIIEDDDF